jgi:hypothetical protein
VSGKIIFEKHDGKYDAMFVARGGKLEELAIPKQLPIPHDMFHYAVEHTLRMRGFFHRAASGEGAGFRMIAEPASESVERLVETMQADSWSGRPPPAEVVELFKTTCAARGDEPFALSEDDITQIRAEIDRLADQWKAVPVRGRMILEI